MILLHNYKTKIWHKTFRTKSVKNDEISPESIHYTIKFASHLSKQIGFEGRLISYINLPRKLIGITCAVEVIAARPIIAERTKVFIIVFFIVIFCPFDERNELFPSFVGAKIWTILHKRIISAILSFLRINSSTCFCNLVSYISCSFCKYSVIFD